MIKQLFSARRGKKRMNCRVKALLLQLELVFHVAAKFIHLLRQAQLITIPNVSRIAAGRLELQIEDVDLVAVVDEVRARLDQARGELLKARDLRPQPNRDDKVLAGWNGLAIAALAEAAAAFDAAGEVERADRYRAAATGAARVCVEGLLDANGRLWRSWKDGRATGSGVLEDYACLAEGLLALYQATFDEHWFRVGRSLADSILERFADPAGGFFDTAVDHETLITRPKDLQDNAVPSGNAMAATALLRLAALTGRDDGARSLELLERSNAFLVPLDEHRFRYRYHPMFLELLRSQLKYQMPDAFALEHRRASRWFAANGLAAKAVRHALAADDVVAATELLSEHWLSLVVRGQAHELANWVDGLAPRVVAGSAELAVAGAGAALVLGDLERAQGYVRLADAKATAVPAKRRARYSLGRAIVTMFDARVRGDFEATRGAAHKVLAAYQLAGAPGDSRAIAHLNLGVAEHWSAQHESGTARLEEALELAQRDSCEFIVVDCLGQLALFKALGGQLREAADFAHTAIGISARRGWEENPAVGSAHLALTIVHFNRCELDEASASLERARLATHRSQTRTTHCLTELFRGLIIARDEIAEGIRVAHAVRRDIDNWGLPSSLAAMAGFFEAALLADAGEPERSRRALAQGSVVAVAPVESAVVLARLALAAGDPAEALRQLQAPSVRDSRAQHPATRIEALALAAVAKNLLHDDEGALDLLEQALKRAQPDGYRLPLLVVGAPLRELLKRRIRAGTGQRALAGELLQTFENERGAVHRDARRSLLDPLSDREEAVLRYLPTVMSKAEIASEMFVSVNTVKTHTKNIYRKLGVGTRTEAVRRARRLNLV